MRVRLQVEEHASRVRELSPLVTTRLAIFTFTATACLVIYAPLMSLLGDGLSGVFKYLADDAFYYLAIADHASQDGLFSFDGTHPTNGFHPLWQVTLAGLFDALPLDSSGQLALTFGLSIFCTALGTGLFALGVLHASHSASLAVVAAVPGLYGWLAPSTHPEFAYQWSFVNGMETPLSILLFGILAWLLLARRLLEREPTPARIALVSALLTLLTFARLDDVFLFLPFLALLWIRTPERRLRLRRVAGLSAIPVLAIGAYLAVNLVYAGVAMPVSGAAKAGGLVEGLGRNLFGIFSTLFPMADLRRLPPTVWGDEAWRVTHMVAPSLIALGWLAVHAPRLRRPYKDESAYHHAILCAMAAYVVLKAAYNFVFVGLWHQGHWYYPLSIMTVNALLATILAGFVHVAGLHRFVPSLVVGTRRISLRPLAGAALVVLVLLVANVFVSVKAHRGDVSNYLFWSNRAAIANALEVRCPGCGLLAFDDGIVAYSLDTPTLNGVGLALDPEALRAKREGRLLPLAWERGYRLMVSVNYPIASDLTPDNLRERLARYPQLAGEDLERFAFTIAWRDPRSGVVFVRFIPRSG